MDYCSTIGINTWSKTGAESVGEYMHTDDGKADLTAN